MLNIYLLLTLIIIHTAFLHFMGHGFSIANPNNSTHG